MTVFNWLLIFFIGLVGLFLAMLVGGLGIGLRRKALAISDRVERSVFSGGTIYQALNS